MQDYRKLKVWQKAHELALAVYEASARFPREEVYALTSQIRRAAASVPSNIVEGCGRGSNAELMRFLYIALGSANEVEYQLLLARDLGFLQPMQPGIKEIMQRFKKVITIEGNWSDDPKDEIIDESNRRYSAVAMLLRSRYLIDVDCWSEVRGQPIKPNTIERVLLEKLKQR